MTARAAAVRLLLAIALLPAGCGGGADGTAAPAADAGRLTVHKALATAIVFAEGSVTHLRVARGGEAVADGLHPVDTLDEALLDRAVPAGRYAVETVERPCSGNCEHLDPPDEATRCRLTVDVRPGSTTAVTIVLGIEDQAPATTCSARRRTSAG